MSDNEVTLDLDAIQARVDAADEPLLELQLAAEYGNPPPLEVAAAVSASAEDVPALVARVRELEAAAKVVEQVRDAIGYGGHDPDCDLERGVMYVPIDDIRDALKASL